MNAKKNSPFNPKLRDSEEKVEKVVNPPQNPTIKKGFQRDEKSEFFCIQPNSNPKRKQPIILIRKVAIGKGRIQKDLKNIFIKNLQAVPKNPPALANNMDFHIISGY